MTKVVLYVCDKLQCSHDEPPCKPRSERRETAASQPVYGSPESWWILLK